MTDRELLDRMVIHRDGRRQKTISFRPEKDGKIHCYAIPGMTDEELIKIVGKHRRALNKMLESSIEAMDRPSISSEEVHLLADKALKVIPPIVKRYAEIMGVTYGRITIRNQKTRWGSCSSKGNLNFNCFLMLCDMDLVEYVVVHELAHRKEMNHSPAFWAEVEKVLPDYRDRLARIKKIHIPYQDK